MDQHPWLHGTHDVWTTLGGDPSALARLSLVARAGALPARLPVRELARACVATCSLAATELAARRYGGAPGRVRLDDGSLATAFTSERQLRIGAATPENFAPLSRIWRTADGWLRTHANYPHHRARLLSALGLSEAEATPEFVAPMIAERSGTEIEDLVYAAGGIAVALRTPEEWERHEHGAAVAARPLLVREPLPGTRSRPLPAHPATSPLLPAAGLRVLDLTRVIAGPVATRTLGLLGADVLRIDSPRLPELADQHADTGFGKRSVHLDLAEDTDRRTFEELLSSADVVVTGYRPGSLDRFGLSPAALAERRPGLVVAQLSAWGEQGPWHERRGFDSVVQFATGIAAAESVDGRPGVLPAQALDHGTGYLLAAAVLRAVSDQTDGAGTVSLRFALAHTARWLTHGLTRPTGTVGHTVTPGPDGAGLPVPHTDGDSVPARLGEAYDSAAPEPWLTETKTPLGRLRHARTPVAFTDGPEDWTRGPGVNGSDAALWV
ncbi:CoA transferase [Streptomyces sp. NA04227]|uniref:CoA transferase n=1 Tax=Streptomyces sp. NA04227 TaxID=2742136 RepID=UPI00159129AB|nr:CoA transferase [Streptomyces sp. NA04227]QKW05769.1 CoA transferase [Streptomyces sp. NA04227]